MIFFWGQRLRSSHPNNVADAQTLDRPINNFDVAGIPRGSWSSSLFHCFQNLIPSCVFAFCCCTLPVLWSQVVVRAQIPTLIDFKNYLAISRRTSGYHLFIDFYCFFAFLGIGLLVLAIILIGKIPSIITILFFLLAIVLLGTFVLVISHVRTAFKAKYEIKSFPDGCGAWECIYDVIVETFCHPCSVAQMARHVFQYDRWDPEIGFNLNDPSTFPPLEVDFRRPPNADNAGVAWIDGGPLPGQVPRTGRNHYVNNTNTTTGESRLPQFTTPSQGRSNQQNQHHHDTASLVYNSDGTVAK